MAKPVPTDVVEAARTGGRDEIELLLRTVWPDAYRLARAILGEDQSAEDAAQEACIILCRTIGSLRSSAAFRSWFYRVVVREAAELKRKRARHEPAPETAPAEIDRSATIDIWRALSVLPVKLREVVVLRYFEDLTSPEIASVLGIPEGTVRFRLMIAKRRLRPLLDESAVRFSPASSEAHTHAV